MLTWQLYLYVCTTSSRTAQHFENLFGEPASTLHSSVVSVINNCDNTSLFYTEHKQTNVSNADKLHLIRPKEPKRNEVLNVFTLQIKNLLNDKINNFNINISER